MRNGGVISGLRRIFSAAFALAAFTPGAADAATLGAKVDNVAQISYSIGAVPVNVSTPPASFTIEAARTPSTIEFFRYSPSAPDACYGASPPKSLLPDPL